MKCKIIVIDVKNNKNLIDSYENLSLLKSRNESIIEGNNNNNWKFSQLKKNKFYSGSSRDLVDSQNPKNRCLFLLKIKKNYRQHLKENCKRIYFQ